MEALRNNFTSFDEVGSSTSTWFLSQAIWGALDDAVGNNKSPLGQEVHCMLA